MGMEEIKLSLFEDNMIVYIENPIDSTKKLLKPISKFGKTAGFKVNIQKLKAVLYKKKGHNQKSVKKFPIAITTRKIKHLGINLTKEVKNLYSEN